MADQLGFVLFGDLDINKTVKNINSQILQLEDKLKTINVGLNIDIKAAFKEIENITGKVSKNTKNSINEELKLAEHIAKLREKSETKTQKVNRQDELKQANAINKALEEQYKLEKDIAIWKEKQEINISKLASKGTIDTSELNNLKDSLNKISAESMDARNEMKSFQNELARVNVEADKSSNSILKTAMSYFTLYDAFQLIKQTAKSMVSSINDINKSLTDIRVVTGMSSKEANELAVSYNDLGKTLGATTNEMLQGSVEWFRQGKTIAETQELITASMVGAKLSGIESAQMTEYLTSALNGYKLEASSAINVIDKFVAVDNAAATSVEELAVAMSRTANSAQMAGVSIDDLIGYIGTVSSVTRRSAETVGESFKTIFSRFQNLKLGKFTEDGEVMSDVRKALANVNIEIMASETKFKDFGSVLDELNSKWGTLTDTEKSSIATAMAGVRQRETFLVLMENMNMSAELTKTSLDSAGLAMERFGIWSEGTEASLNRFKNTAEELFMNTLNSDTINNIINISTSIVSTVDKIGLLNVAFITLAGTMVMVGKAKNIAWLTSLPSLLGAATSGVTALTSALLSNPLFLGAVGLVGAIKLIDTLTVTLDEQREKVEKLENRYSELTSELEQLRSIENPTEANERKIQLLERELELQEKLLDIEKQKLVDKEYSSYYSDLESSLDGLIEKIAIYEEQTKMMASPDISDAHFNMLKRTSDVAYEGIVKYASELNDAYGNMDSILSDLDDTQKENVKTLMNSANTYLNLSDEILGIDKKTTNAKESMDGFNASVSSANESLEKASSEESDLSQAASELSKQFDNASDKIATLNAISKELKESNGLSADSFKKIASEFPELLGYMNDEASLADAIKDKMESLSAVQGDAYRQMLFNSEEYYEQNVLGNEQMINSISSGIENLFRNLSTAYDGDLNNWKTLAQGKADIENQLIASLNKAWESHFGTLMTQFNKMANTPIANPQFDEAKYREQLSKDNPLLTSTQIDRQLELARNVFNKQTSEYKQFQAEVVKRNQELSNMFSDVKFDAIDIKVGGGKGSKSKKKSSKDSFEKYYSQLIDETIDTILSENERLEDAIAFAQEKLANAELKGDTKQQEILNKQILEFTKQKKELSHKMAEELRKVGNDVRIQLGNMNIKGYENFNFANLTELDVAKIKQSYDKLAVGASDSVKANIEVQKSMFQELANVVIRIYGEEIPNLQKQWWSEDTNHRQQQIDAIHKIADIEKRAYDDKVKRIQLEQMLMDDSGKEYQAKEEEKYQLLLGLKLRYEDKIRQLKAQGLNDEAEDVRKYKELWYDAEEELVNMRKSMAERQREIGLKGYEERLKVLNDQKAAIKTISDLTIQMIKKEIEIKKKAFQEEINGYQAVINKKKESLRKEKEDKDYKKELSEIEKQEEILNNKIAELSLDNSGDMNEKRLELEEELRELLEKKEELQNDKSLQNKEDLLDKELEAFEKEKQEEIDKLDEYLDKEGQLRQDALDMIKRNNKEMYEKLLEYNATYGDAMQEDIVKAWGLATDAANEFNNGQMDLLDILKDVTDEMAEQVRLQDELKNAHWADIPLGNNTENSPSGSGSTGGSSWYDKKDKIAKQMQSNSKEWFNASDEQKKKLAQENEKLGQQIGAWKGSDGEWWIMINGKRMKLYDSIGVRHTGIETGFVGGKALSKGSQEFMKLMRGEEFNILNAGEIVANPRQMDNVMNKVIPGMLARNSKTPELKIEGDLCSIVINGNADKDTIKLLRKETDRIANYTLDKLKGVMNLGY